nr:endonuclease MutS2 [Dendronalium phyllosphericum CENA369]
MIQSDTLELLEWHRLCQHLSTFAATKLGAIASLHLKLPESQAVSEQLLAQTKEVYQLESRLSTGLSFEGIQDIGDSLERAERSGILAGDELLALATTLAGARNLRRVIDNQEDIPILTELVADLRTYPELEQEIHRCIDERGQVTDRASQKLGEIRTELRRLRSQITQKLQNILQVKSGAVQEQLITQRGDRFVIPVKAPQKDAIPGIVHDTSTSGATLYVEPNSVVPLGNQLRQTIKREQAEEEAIRRALTEQVAAVKPDLERLLAIVTTLDLATARARYSFWLGANPPRFINRPSGDARGLANAALTPVPHRDGSRQDGGWTHEEHEIITLRHLRHPLLVWQQHHEQGQPVVPVDLLIAPHIKVVTITGPNTGGKTVTLKTLGLAALMAKVGLFVPAREPVEIPWFDQVLADIGDEQSLQQSLSTFSGHIRRISRILDALGGDAGTRGRGD